MLIGAAMGTVMFWMAVVAAAVAYVIDHAFAIALGAAAVVVAIVVTHLLARRRGSAVHWRQSWPVALPPTYPAIAYPDPPRHRIQEMPR
jgi:hypothetical protein